MTSAQRTDEFDLALPEDDATSAAPRALELRQQVAERLVSHRARRASTSAGDAPTSPASAPQPGRGRAAQIAAAVAQRYAQTPSYRSFLASEAERSVQQAQAAAEIATINAQAIAMAQQQLMADLEHWDWSAESAGARSVSPDAARATASVVTTMLEQREAHGRAETRLIGSRGPRDGSPVHQVASPGFTVKLYEDVGTMVPTASRSGSQRMGGGAATPVPANERESEALDEEIAFRKDPYFDELTAPEPIAANLIEFPRQLVASRKARPRRAEGPLLDDPRSAESVAQLRIFEVQADQMSAAPANESVTPEWTSIMLGALPAAEAEPTLWGELSPTLVPQTAPLSLRVMSGLVDGAIVMVGTLVFAAAAIKTDALLSHGAYLQLSLPFAAGSFAGALVVLATIYLLLSFTFGDSTAGMRYARIGLCTFGDENPSRQAMRRRIFAMALSAVPVGLGFLWACVDEDRLGWHDRMSRMYQRAY